MSIDPNLHYLMLLTKDKKKFFTPMKNFQCLIEYAKTFNAQMFQVKIKEGKVLELKNLVVALCDPEYTCDITYSETARLFPELGRDKILKNAEMIQSFIRKRLLGGKTVSLKELKEKYEKLKITDACLCNHLSTVRKALIREGRIVEKVGAGAYCLTKEKTNVKE